MATEVFNRIGEAELHSENEYFYRKKRDEEPEFTTSKTSEKIESMPKPMVKVKKEFFENLEDDSLTIDTCSKLNHDWEKK